MLHLLVFVARHSCPNSYLEEGKGKSTPIFFYKLLSPLTLSVITSEHQHRLQLPYDFDLTI